jgi:imidazole glycerol-phosphate synthase subunit HisH
VTTVVVLDYGSGNIRSAERAVARAGAEVTVTTDARLASAADGLVVPGVGAFAACMAGLVAVGGPEVIDARRTSGQPTLAICVGHQVLFEAGIEHGLRTEGCGILPGLVEQLQAERLPHMGWNTIEAATSSQLFAGIESERFYFVHSYGVRALPAASERRITWAEHGGDRFVAAVEDGPLWSTQLTPALA